MYDSVYRTAEAFPASIGSDYLLILIGVTSASAMIMDSACPFDYSILCC